VLSKLEQVSFGKLKVAYFWKTGNKTTKNSVQHAVGFLKQVADKALSSMSDVHKAE